MKKYIVYFVALMLPLSSFADHREESKPEIQYVLTQGIKADNPTASAGAAAKFLQSGVLGKRGWNGPLWSKRQFRERGNDGN